MKYIKLVGTLKQQTKILIFNVYDRYIKHIYRRIIVNPRLKEIIEAIVSELRVILEHNFDPVHMIFIETITACNLRCPYCPNSIYDRGLIKNMKKMETKLFHKIIDELSELKWVGEIQPHSYGEPLLDDRIIDLIEYAKKKIPGLIINFFTNGELLNVSLYKQLTKAGVNKFTVTQHLPTPAKGVLEVLDYRKKFGSENVGFRYGKITYIFNRSGLISVEDGVKKTKCNWPSHNIGISYDGSVLICCHDYLNEVKVGNVNDERLIDIWNKPLYKKIRKDIAKGRFTFDLCKRCLEGKVTT
ncbi:MAG: SPASM domain-containing protein [Candidatus Omnitrophota bacterium]|nr:MAG: SPASM domain-containing protein [Candidatus Omnitrophota bacterium]